MFMIFGEYLLIFPTCVSVDCAAGYYSSSAGAVECALCAAGYTSSAGAGECSRCVEGYFWGVVSNSTDDDNGIFQE